MNDNCPICGKEFRMKDALHTFCSKYCQKKGHKLRKENADNAPLMKWATRKSVLSFRRENAG